MTSLLLELVKLPIHFFMEIFYFITRCRPLKKIQNQDILITGAAQGIGAEFARQLADMGNRVHLVDLNEKLLLETADSLKSKGLDVYTYTCDLSKKEQVKELYNEINSAGFAITFLVNNAGVAFITPITEMTLTQIEHSIAVNLMSSLWLIKLFLPKMLEMDEGHVLNVASLAGKFAMELSTDYCAAKAGSIHMIEQLRAQYCNSQVKFSVVCPWFVDTKMISGVDLRSVRAVSPEFVVLNAIKGVRENKEVICVPNYINNILSPLNMILPAYLKNAMRKKRHAIMEQSGVLDKIVGQQMAETIK